MSLWTFNRVVLANIVVANTCEFQMTDDSIDATRRGTVEDTLSQICSALLPISILGTFLSSALRDILGMEVAISAHPFVSVPSIGPISTQPRLKAALVITRQVSVPSIGPISTMRPQTRIY